jgi:hypothetical protein
MIRESVRSIDFVSLVYINHFKVKLFWVELLVPQIVHKISAKFAAFLKGKWLRSKGKKEKLKRNISHSFWHYLGITQGSKQKKEGKKKVKEGVIPQLNFHSR